MVERCLHKSPFAIHSQVINQQVKRRIKNQIHVASVNNPCLVALNSRVHATTGYWRRLSCLHRNTTRHNWTIVYRWIEGYIHTRSSSTLFQGLIGLKVNKLTQMVESNFTLFIINQRIVVKLKLRRTHKWKDTEM